MAKSRIEVYFKEGKIYFEGLVDESFLIEGMQGFIIVLNNYMGYSKNLKTGSRFLVMVDIVFNEDLQAYEFKQKFTEKGIKFYNRKIKFQDERGDINSDSLVIETKYAYGYDLNRYRRVYSVIGKSKVETTLVT